MKVVVVERPQGSPVSRPVVVERRAQVEQEQREEEGGVHRCSLYWRCVLVLFDVRVKEGERKGRQRCWTSCCDKVEALGLFHLGRWAEGEMSIYII